MKYILISFIYLTLIIPGTVFSNNNPLLLPYKDDLFKYPKILSSDYYGESITIDYSQKRDLEDRDRIDEKVVYEKYITNINKDKNTLSYSYQGKNMSYIQVGKDNKDNKVITIYIHGMGGSRKQGVDDNMFGGNFNRIGNLMLKNNGIYLSPDFSNFGKVGIGQIQKLISLKKITNPKAKIFVACGSSGGDICWGLFKNHRNDIDGILLLGSTQNFSIDTSKDTKMVPIYMGHGIRDKSIPYMGTVRLFNNVKTNNPNYPIRLHLFNGGTHGTPIRMTDWKYILNWMDGITKK